MHGPIECPSTKTASRSSLARCAACLTSRSTRWPTRCANSLPASGKEQTFLTHSPEQFVQVGNAYQHLCIIFPTQADSSYSSHAPFASLHNHAMACVYLHVCVPKMHVDRQAAGVCQTVPAEDVLLLVTKCPTATWDLPATLQCTRAHAVVWLNFFRLYRR